MQRQKVSERVVKAGDIIVEEGQPVTRFATLLEGWAFRFKTLPDGRRQILNVLMHGDMVGLQSKLFAEAVHGVEALTDSRLCMFARDGFSEIFRSFPALAFDLTWLCASEERLVDEVLLSVGRRMASERISMLVLHLWERAKPLGLIRDGALPFPLTQTHIADMLGLSYVHTNRTLQDLRRLGLFDLSGGVLSAVNEPALRELSRYEEPAEQRPLF